MKKWVVFAAVAMSLVSCGKQKYSHTEISWKSLLLVTTNMWAGTKSSVL
jgi:hypothetical protein